MSDLADREAIHTLMARYNIEGDRGNIEGLASVFADDGVLEFGGAATTGRAAIIERLSGGRGPRNPALTVVRHHLTTSLIEIDGDGATGRTYLIVMTDIGPDHHGVYVDRFRRTADGWRIAHRQVRIDWQSPQSLFPPSPVRGRPAG
ncbi:MAG: nuclear transport factor 2 family protein [Sphingobium sp.]